MAKRGNGRPLEDVGVVDCGTLFAGPLAGMFLADFGADVIKVEHPSGGALREFGGHGLAWKWVNRNKESFPLNLSDPEGQEIFREVVGDTDVLIESFRPGTLERWNLGWETLREINPGLVMIRTTGFGQTGAYRDRPGFGTLAEAMSGFAHVTGFPDKPPTLPSLGLADAVAALYSTFAALSALYWRDVGDGTGQYIDASLVESMFGIMGKHAVEYSVRGVVHGRSGNRSSSSAPRNTYRTKDDRWVAISGSTQSIAERVLRIVGGEELAADPRFETMSDRLENVESLDAIVQEWMAKRSREEVLRVFSEAEAAVAPVYDISDIFDDDYFWDRQALVSVPDEEVGEVSMPGVFPRLSETPGAIEHAGPGLGEHTRAVLERYTSVPADEVDDLARRGVIALPDRAGDDAR